MSFKKAKTYVAGGKSFKAYVPTKEELKLEDRKSCGSFLEMAIWKHQARMLNILAVIHAYSNKNEKGAHMAALILNIDDSDVGSKTLDVYYCLNALKEFTFVTSKKYYDKINKETMPFFKLKNKYIGEWATRKLFDAFDNDPILVEKINKAKEHTFNFDHFVELN